MAIKLKKAKISKSGCLEASYIDEDGNKVSIEGKNPVHLDLKVRLKQLVPFLADLTEQKEASKIDWYNLDSPENDELLRHLDVSGVSIGGSSESPVATLIGKRTLLTSKVLNICVPATGMNIEDEVYTRYDEFRDAVYAFMYEAELYITERKWSVQQGEFNFDNEEDPFGNEGVEPEDVSIEEPEFAEAV